MQGSEDRLEHEPFPPVDVGIREAKDLKPELREVPVALPVRGRLAIEAVLLAVGFDDNTGLEACEIHDEAADRYLPAKVKAGQHNVLAKPVPQLDLLWRHPLAQGAREALRQGCRRSTPPVRRCAAATLPLRGGIIVEFALTFVRQLRKTLADRFGRGRGRGRARRACLRRC